MPRKRRTVTNRRPPLLKTAFLLIQFILVQIGEIPLFFIKKALYLLSLRKQRGRPRTTKLTIFYGKRIKKFIYHRFSKRTRVSVVVITIIIGVFLYTSFILSTAYQLPSPNKLTSFEKPLTTEIYDRNGKLLYRLYGGKNRSLVKLEDLPTHLVQATISIEDQNFYNHPGIDFLAITRALYHNYNSGQLEGASTITQQLIKNTLLTPEKTYSRKIKEAILSLWVERVHTKAEILQMYFNEVPFGGPNWGIQAASESYFDKKPQDLTLAESAFLAGLPASPTQFSPFGTNPELGIERQKEVLRRMLEDRYINEEQYNKALVEKLSFKTEGQDIFAPHFVFYIKNTLAQKYGEKIVSEGGLKVITTLDLDLQEEVEKIVSQEIDALGSLNVKNGAAMITDASTGQILTMVGSRAYNYPGFGNYNSALALRQPGSSIKVVTYATAFKKGYSPGNTILDVPVKFSDEWGNSYSPVNYDGKFRGPVSLRTALGASLNTPAVRLLASVGMDSMIQTAKDMGITTFNDPKRYGLSLTLGGGEAKMIDLMAVYNTLSQMGSFRKPTGILKVTDSNGNVLEEYKNSSKQVLQPEVAYLISDILADNKARSIAFGPNSLLNIPGQTVSVKTGTSDSKRDNWTFGYTSDFVVGVWVGNPDNTPMHPSLTSGVTGAAPIWNKIMRGLLVIKPGIAFNRPSTVIESNIDGRKDLMVAGNLPKGLVRIKTDSEKTIFSDAFSSFATASAQAAIKDGSTN